MAAILDAFVGRCVDKLSELIKGEMSMMLGVKDELKKLQRRMERISGFLESAERKRHENRNINTWVSELKDVVYDADDIIDHCMNEVRILLENHPSMAAVRYTPSSFIPFGLLKFQHEIGNKIRELNDRLKEINEDRSMLPALEYTKQSARETGVDPRQTFPSVIRSDIVGTKIEEATQSLVELLIKEDNKKFRVLGIVGMGGIGKTTLASNIYNNKIIKENFPIRVWVCISQDFSETKLLKEIIRGAGGNYKEFETKAELVPYLSSLLSQKYFIVLDDLWKTDVWEDLLRYSFENATTTGKIVITTRDTNVARSIRADIHHVDKMDSDNGWKLLCKIVFGDDDDEEEEEEISSLKKIGVQIVEKCDGLPLAIKVIAGVLRMKERNKVEWNKVLKSDTWSMSRLHEKLPGSLFLSYEDLPSVLKQCFLYCSLFPGDHPMRREDLIRCWVAEGFVKPAQKNILMEDLAEDCCRELIGRNLLQPCEDLDDIDDLGDPARKCCKMHGLLRSLALFLTRDESIFLGDEQSPNTNSLSKFRRLSIDSLGKRVEVPDVIKQQKCLRTLLVRWSYNIVENELFGSLRLLRVMILRYTGLESFPDSLGDLFHLRYLYLDEAWVKELPESVGRLVNLEILDLSGCGSLHMLPKAITKLYNLRCLRLPGALTHVPKGMGNLQHLNHLERFVVSHDDRRDMQDDEGCGLEELQSLSQLRFLEMMNLERAQAGGAPVLANSHSLSTLILRCEPPKDEEEAIEPQRIDEIYNDLCPPSTYLQRLEIHDFFGTGFPGWIMSISLGASFPSLTFIDLYSCKSCPQLPPLGLLLQLKFLRITGADAIKTIGPEFLGSCASSFPKLEVLFLSYMPNLEEWSFGVEEVGESSFAKLLPCLKKLTLSCCPNLRALPPLCLLPQLKFLSIVGAKAIKTIGPEFLCPRASSAATSFPKLEELYFSNMSNWEAWSFGMVEEVDEESRGAPKLLPRLRKLNLKYSRKLGALPEGLRHATNLQELIVVGVNSLKEINNLPSTDRLEIRVVGGLERISNLPSLKSLEIYDCRRLVHVENLDKLQFLKVNFNLYTRTIGDRDIDDLPQWLLELLQNAPAALRSLKEFQLICSLPLLKTFLKNGPNWSVIQPIPQVRIEEFGGSSYIQYTKGPPTFKMHIKES